MAAVTEQLQHDDNTFIHPWDDLKNLGKNKRTVITGADGIYVQDSDGNKLIDGPGGMWCVNIGHGRQELIDAMAEQAGKLSYYSPWSLTNAPAARLAAKLAELSPGDLNHVFFATGGSTAVDSALRFVMFYNNVLGRPNKKQVISRMDAYHGSTYLSASASGKARDKTSMDFADMFHHIPSPNPFRRPKGMSIQAFCDEKVADLENRILELGHENVGAFIAEGILASGGVVVPPPGYHKACLEVCRKYDVIYISDEVVTGFGRLGHFFASQAVFDIEPDIITCAKGLTSGYVPMGATLISDRLIGQVAESKGSGVFSNGFTYSGHPVACAVALKNIEIMERENIMEHVREVGPYLQDRLQELRELPIVEDVRGMGLMGCVECSIQGGSLESSTLDIEIGTLIDKHCQSMGLMVRPLYHMCVMSPPLIIEKPQIDDLVSILRRGIEKASEEARRIGLWSG